VTCFASVQAPFVVGPSSLRFPLCGRALAAPSSSAFVQMSPCQPRLLVDTIVIRESDRDVDAGPCLNFRDT
jgi:hypothetical protein